MLGQPNSKDSLNSCTCRATICLVVDELTACMSNFVLDMGTALQSDNMSSL